jgi:WD40 repeat protein
VLVSCSSNGDVNLYDVRGGITSNNNNNNNNNNESKGNSSSSTQLQATRVHQWKALHGNKQAATCIDVSLYATQQAQPQIASCGEDGAINILSAATSKVTRRLKRASSSSIHALRFSGPHTLVACGIGGRVLTWDLRAQTIEAASVCVDANAGALSALAVHPSRPDTLATGAVNGILSTWDTRQASVPLCSLQAHESMIWDALFLPSLPTCIVTCSEDGALCLFDFNKTRADPTRVTFGTEQAQHNIHPMKLYSAAGSALNALDVEPRTQMLVCPTDDESLLFFQHQTV